MLRLVNRFTRRQNPGTAPQSVGFKRSQRYPEIRRVVGINQGNPRHPVESQILQTQQGFPMHCEALGDPVEGSFVGVANITKRTERKLADQLEDDEIVELALLLEATGTYRLGAVRQAIGIDRLRDRRYRTSDGASPTGVAGEFPAPSCVLVATQHRVFAAPSNGIRFGSIEFGRPLGHVWMTLEKWRLGRQVELSFNDGSHLRADVGRGQPFDQMAARLATR